MDDVKCEVCGATDSSKYYTCRDECECKGMVLCNKHYMQIKRHGHLLDRKYTQSVKRNMWTKSEEEKFEELYKEGKSFKEISKILGRTENSLNSKSADLKLGKKYMRKNNVKFKAVYQDYDWCYERYIGKGMSHEEMAKECGASLRVIQKWCSEIHRLNQWTFKNEKKLNDLQKQLVMFGTLGDGHIDRRIDQPIYIESHAEDQKDYLYWKYKILESLCNQPPVKHPPQKDVLINGILCDTQSFYRFGTRIINELGIIRDTPRIEIIKQLNEFGLSVHMLDDGSRSSSNWELCLAEYTDEEVNEYLFVCKNKFELNANRLKDDRYILFDAPSSRKIDEIILNNIPNDLDIVKDKIIENKINDAAKYVFILCGDKKIGLNTYCRSHNLVYKKCKELTNQNNITEILEEDFLRMVS